MAQSPLSAFAEEEEPSAPFWMATFSDMMTLLLAFFVMIVAMSEVQVQQFEEALSYFTGRRGILENDGSAPGVISVAPPSDARQQAEQYEEIARDIQEMEVEDAVEVDLTSRGIRVTFVDSIAFPSGSVVLDEKAQRVLARVATLAQSSAVVEVEGHTDDVPISTVAYPSNWELSAARAAAVVRYLAAQPDAPSPSRYIAVGFGEHRPRDTNETPQGRARNRRITVLFRTADTSLEPMPLFPSP